MKESQFQSELTHSIGKYYIDCKIPYWYHKFPDMASKDWQSGKKPFDCMLCIEWLNIWMELKSTLKLKSFSVDKVRWHQVYNLRKIKETWWNAWIIIYVTEFHTAAIFDVDRWVEISQQTTKATWSKSIKNNTLLLLADFTIKKDRLYWWDFLRLTRRRETSLDF